MFLPDNALQQIAKDKQSEMFEAAISAGRLRVAGAGRTHGRVALAEQAGRRIGRWFESWRSRAAAPPAQRPTWSQQPADRPAA